MNSLIFSVIDETPGDAVTKRRIIEKLARTFGGREVYVGTVFAESRAEIAGRMLRSGMTRAEVAVAMSERFSITTRAARYHISRALKWRLHQKPTPPG